MRSPTAINAATDCKGSSVEPTTLHYEHCFNIVVKGVEECPKGMSRMDTHKHDFDENYDSDL